MKAKKIKTTLYIVTILWIALLTQVIVQSVLNDDARITQAFASADSDIVESRVEVAAEYGSRYLSEGDKKELIDYIAKGIGIHTEYSLKKRNKDNTVELIGEKLSQNGKVLIDIISTEKDVENNLKELVHYILVDMSIYEDSDSILSYKEKIENVMKEIEVKEYQSIVKFSGSYDGKLSLTKKEEISNKLLHNLEAKKISENITEDLYLVYGYTGIISDYIRTGGHKVNLNIVITYNEENDTTNLYLATPILNDNY